MAERLRAGHAAFPRRRLGLATLVLAVVLVHACVTEHLADRLAAMGPAAAMPARIEVAYVRELELAAPVRVSAPPPAAAPRRVARAAPAASAPAPATLPSPEAPVPPPAPEPVPEPVSAPPTEPAAPSPVAAAASVPEPAASAPPEAAVAAAPEPGASAVDRFDWPASTRLSYKLTGHVRGEVHGDAQVEWVRAGTRYQVHLDITVGLPIAPLVSRRMSSDGELTAEGLSPRRYDEDTKVAFRERRRATLLFEPDAVVLPGGRRHARWPGVQDTASQFVQLSWLFTLRPELLRTGASVEVPLALARNVDRWVYDVLEEEILYTPFGAVSAFHLKPRRVSRAGGDLSAEIWFAPQLRYLPVRIRIHQDAETFIDLMLARRPELAEP